MHLPLLQKAMKLWWFNSLFKQHPSHNSSLRFPLKLSSTRSSSPSVWAACWSLSWPWKCTLWWCRTGSYQAKAAESSLWGKKKVLTSEADLVTGPIGSATKRQPPTCQSLILQRKSSDILTFYFYLLQKDFVIWWAPNYSCKHRLVKSDFRNRTLCLPSSNVENMVA